MTENCIEKAIAACLVAKERPNLSAEMHDLAKNYIGVWLSAHSQQIEDAGTIEVVDILRPALEAMSYLPTLEQAACLTHLREIGRHKIPSEYALRSTMATFKPLEDHQTEVVVSDFSDILSREISPSRPIVGPWLMEGNLALIHAWRGTGKSLFVMGVAAAIATGRSFLGWENDGPRNVLIVDGELNQRTIQQRLKMLAPNTTEAINKDALRFVQLDEQRNGMMPNLGTLEGQSAFKKAIERSDVVVLDNLACLVRSGKENEAESWRPMASWLLSLRSANKSVILIHHSNKSGQQRGTSAKEDIMDSVLCLKRPETEGCFDGTAFELHFEKNRHFFGSDTDPLLIKYSQSQGWSRENVEGFQSQVEDLRTQGMNQSQIARVLGKHRSTISRNWR